MIAMFEEEAGDEIADPFYRKTAQLSPIAGLDTIPLHLIMAS
jgi:hypothetical protein